MVLKKTYPYDKHTGTLTMSMHNPFQPVEKIKTEVFMSMPDKFRKKARTGWSDPNRQNA